MADVAMTTMADIAARRKLVGAVATTARTALGYADATDHNNVDIAHMITVGFSLAEFVATTADEPNAPLRKWLAAEKTYKIDTPDEPWGAAALAVKQAFLLGLRDAAAAQTAYYDEKFGKEIPAGNVNPPAEGARAVPGAPLRQRLESVLNLLKAMPEGSTDEEALELFLSENVPFRAAFVDNSGGDKTDPSHGGPGVGAGLRRPDDGAGAKEKIPFKETLAVKAPKMSAAIAHLLPHRKSELQLMRTADGTLQLKEEKSSSQLLTLPKFLTAAAVLREGHYADRKEEYDEHVQRIVQMSDDNYGLRELYEYDFAVRQRIEENPLRKLTEPHHDLILKHLISPALPMSGGGAQGQFRRKEYGRQNSESKESRSSQPSMQVRAGGVMPRKRSRAEAEGGGAAANGPPPKSRKVCSFFNGPKGCNQGNACKFVHSST
jgi:hypothetical protein